MNENPRHANVRFPPPVLALLHIAFALFLNWLVPFPTTYPHMLRWSGMFFVLAGLALAFLAVSRFRRAGTTLDPHSPVSALVTDGPYGFSRNPIYLGFMCTLIGLPLALGTYWGILLAPLFLLLINYLVIRYEEEYLESRFGESYSSYKSRVRRWL